MHHIGVILRLLTYCTILSIGSHYSVQVAAVNVGRPSVCLSVACMPVMCHSNRIFNMRYLQ